MQADVAKQHKRDRRKAARRRRVALSLTALAVSLGMLSASARPASAVSGFRLQLPINAGTFVRLGEWGCTTGAVLSSRSWYLQLSARLKAVRYIVLAGHCGEVGDSISVGSQANVGKVIWKARAADIMIARIDPLARTNWGCDGSTSLHRCMPITTYTPRAVGNVFLFDQAGRYASVPVTGSGTPGVNEIFCTSGAISGVNCSWGLQALPHGAPPFILGATTWRNVGSPGDSGGPVVSRSGQLYGTISQGGDAWGNIPDFMSFVPIARLFEEQPGYQLAPPG